MKLPDRLYTNYIGIDPGFTGGLGRINQTGTVVKAYDMPITGSGRRREYDLDVLNNLFLSFTFLPDCVIGLEYPEVQPRWGSAQCEKLGRGKGYLEALAVAHNLPMYRIVPVAWKNLLDLPGKTDTHTNEVCIAYWDERYPEFEDVLYGPMGGLKDGRLDALLIAHLMRIHTLYGEEFYEDSE